MTQMFYGKTICLVSLSCVFMILTDAAWGYDPGKFPGKGTKADYVRAFALSNKGVALEEQGKPREAAEAFKSAIAIYPYASAFYNNYGNALADLNEYLQALDSYKKAIDLAQDNGEAYCSMADVLTRLKKYDPARDACKKALELNPRNAVAMINLAEVFLATDEPAQAKKWLNDALAETREPALKKIITADLEKANKMAADKTQTH